MIQPEHGDDARLHRHRRARSQQTVLDALLKDVADRSFNRITIDGDTSTNDSFVLDRHRPRGDARAITRRERPALRRDSRRDRCDVAQELAQAIVRDGEGATKFITVTVEGGRDASRVRPDRARDRALAAGEDRVLRLRRQPRPHRLRRRQWRPAPISTRRRVDIHLDDVLVVEHGGRARVVSRGRRRARDEAERDHGAREPRSRQRGGDGLDLRPLARLREHQRRLPELKRES